MLYHSIYLWELNEDLVFLNRPLSVALIGCVLELFVWGSGGLAQTCRVLGKVTAESDGLSILEMKSWFTCASVFPGEWKSLYDEILSSCVKKCSADTCYR